ncbi:aldo/keto reductase family protein [Nonomuraea sp. NPDC003709]|uniref:aldo/keto reductase family protein n=1 Tax=Nonomuraea sp. NPDC003709 TaxID=3154450 RepID=UPI0033AD13A8
MEFRRLGRSGLSVSAISYGHWLAHDAPDQEERARACVTAALDAGITTFITADAYANTAAESVLGRALKGQRRESLEISTKVFWPTGPGGPNDKGLGRKHVMESARASLRRLGTDYLDVYQAHRFDRTVPLEETMVAFADLVRQGHVLYVGVSEWTAEQITRSAALARELHVPLVSNEAQYSALWRVIEAEVVPACEREGLSQLAWSPVAQGVLTGKYRPGQPAPAGSRGADLNGAGSFIQPFLREDVLVRVQRLRPLADEAGLSLGQLALAWVLRRPNVASAIIGASRPEQVRENVQAAEVRLDADLMERIDQVLGGVVETNPALTTSP